MNLPELPEYRQNREVMNFSFFTARIAMAVKIETGGHLLLI